MESTYRKHLETVANNVLGDEGDFPGSVQIFIFIYNIIQNVSLDSVGRFFIFGSIPPLTGYFVVQV